MGSHLNMCGPGLLGGGDGSRDGVVEELGVFAQATPQAKALPGIVALVDQVALGGIGAVALLQGLGGAFPGLGLEAAVLAQAQLDALAQAAEEGGLVGGGPAEARRSAIAVDTGGGGLAVGAEHVAVVLGHGRESQLGLVAERRRMEMERREECGGGRRSWSLLRARLESSGRRYRSKVAARLAASSLAVVCRVLL